MEYIGATPNMSFFLLIMLLAGAGVLIGLVLWAVLWAARGSRNRTAVAPPSAPVVPPEEQQAFRTQVLQELSEGKISREEAEQKIRSFLGIPVERAMEIMAEELKSRN